MTAVNSEWPLEVVSRSSPKICKTVFWMDDSIHKFLWFDWSCNVIPNGRLLKSIRFRSMLHRTAYSISPSGSIVIRLASWTSSASTSSTTTGVVIEPSVSVSECRDISNDFENDSRDDVLLIRYTKVGESITTSRPLRETCACRRPLVSEGRRLKQLLEIRCRAKAVFGLSRGEEIINRESHKLCK